MAYEHNDGTATLFVFTPKGRARTSRDPVMSGSGKDINGNPVRLAVWVATDKETGQPRTDRNGNKFYNVKIEADEQAQPQPAPATMDSFDDEPPF